MNLWKEYWKKGFNFSVTIPWPEGPAADKRKVGDMSIKTFFQGLFNKFVPIFKAFLAEAFPIAKQLVIAALKDIALQAVMKAGQTNLKNEEKRKQAFNEIKAYAIQKGIETGDNLINVALEIAVSKFKG